MRNFSSIVSILLVFFFVADRAALHWAIPVYKGGQMNKLMVKKVPKKDRMDLAWQQEREMTQDPELGDVPKERLIEAWKYTQQLIAQQGLRKAAIPTISWTERGPNNCGGRTRAICVDLNDATRNTIWAGGVAGGLWKTTNIGASSPNWTPINEFFSNMAITFIDQAKGNPNVMYFCTGEGNGNSDAVRGLGVWKSTNGGSTWTQLATTNNNSNFYYCNKVFTLGAGDTVFVCTMQGLFRSVNGGTTFTKVLGQGISSATGNRCYDIERTFNGTLFSSVSSSSNNTGTIHRSTDGGATWSTPATINTVSKREIELAVSDYDNNVVWGLVENASTITGIIRSTNGGVTFSPVAAYPDDADTGIPANDFSRTQAWYDLSIAVDPNDPTVCFVGGIDLFKTSDAGATWNQVSHWWGGYGFQEVHADQHNAIFAPGSSTVAYFTNDGGVYRTTNAHASMPSIQSKEINYNTTQFYACDVHPTNSNYFLAGAQDNGSHRFNTAGVNGTSEVTGGDGAFCHIDQNQPSFQFTSYVYNNYYRSSNGGSSFTNVISSNTGRFINPTDYDDSMNVFYGASGTGTFFRWSNPQTGTTTATVTLTGGPSAQVTAVEVSPNVVNRVYFGFTGSVYRVDNAHTGTSVTATNITSGSAIPSGYISCVEVEKGNENHILITITNYGLNSVWETRNGGTTWTSIEGNLPDMPIRWIVLHPQNGYKALVATELGVWSTDSLMGSNTNWGPTNTGLANVRVDMLKVRPSDNLIAAATHARGLYTAYLPIYNSNQTPVVDFAVSNNTIYPGEAVTFNSQAQGATSYFWEFGDGTTSTLQNPTKIYANAGVYDVKLTINGGVANSLKTGFVRVLPYRGTPYTLSAGGNFETNPNDFISRSISGSSFVRGSSSVTGKNGVVSGTNAWVLDPTASTYQDYTTCYLYCPSFNMTAIGTYTLSFYLKNLFELDYDGMRLEYSLNSGQTWVPLGTSPGTNWYDFANTAGDAAFPINQAFFNSNRSNYTLCTYNMSSLAGNSKVCLRFVFLSDPAVNAAGLAIDDFFLNGPSNNPLPVSWAYVRGLRVSENEVNLNWATYSETNTMNFEVERSEDAKTWVKTGQQNAAGNSSKLIQYRFNDQQAPSGHLYYRIRQNDRDGKFSYSELIRIQPGKESGKLVQQVYQSTQSRILEIVSNSQEELKVSIYTLQGQLIEADLKVQQGQLLLPEAAKGVVLLKFTNAFGQRQVEKVFIAQD
ncbi:MAG: PKD domain-containing protein [Bacteroidetes bacterium]|nr:PKD domain-containing protein [Bacteroidota bacterium]